MNNKENVVVSEGGLSAEQRTRISQNFRAAKALLARKRPFQTLNASNQFHHKAVDTWGTECPPQVVGIKRVPLSDIPKNTQSSELTEGLKLTNHDCVAYLCPKVLTTGKIDDDSTGAAENGMLSSNLSSMKCAAESNLLVTPVRQSSFSGLSQTLSLSSVPDDLFDESILEEIDALCEKSTVKSERGVSTNTPVRSQYIDKSTGENNTCLNLFLLDEKVNTESVSNSSDNHECGSEVLRNFETHTKNMPEEYTKYMQSLNDRQREAACSDISTPIMIVAGPGSGKTSTMVGRVLMLMHEGIDPSHILAMTFTTAAASEMRERIGAVAGKATAKELTISTFHSFSLQLCRLHADKLDRTADFLIYGHGQQRRAVIEAVRVLKDGKKLSNHEPDMLCEVSGASSPQYFKDKSKKWLKFVAK